MLRSDVVVVGLGYIGLPTAVALARSGVHVFGVDVKPEVVDAVNAGEVPLVEPGLAEELVRVRSSGKLHAGAAPVPAITYIIAVPTPFLPDRSADLSYIRAAAESIAPVLSPGALVILESTSPPGTTKQLADWIAELRPDLAEPALAISLAYCPERVLPGKIMTELVENDRVIGGMTPLDASRAAAVYATFCTGSLLKTTALTAEMTKLVENTYRDVNIAFANELSQVCETVGVDVWELIELANHHPRVNVLQPGPGVGGHCIAVDPWFLIAADPRNTKLIRTARQVNDDKPRHVVQKVVDAVAGLANPTIAALGLAFKPDIEDIRESPARTIVGILAERLPDARIKVVEPHLTSLPPELTVRANVELTSIENAAAEADCAVLLVNHAAFATKPEFRTEAVVIDTRGQWDGATSREPVGESEHRMPATH